MKVVFAKLSSLEQRQLFCIADIYGFHPTNVNWRSYYLGHDKDGGVWAQHWWSGSGVGYFLLNESVAFRRAMVDALADNGQKVEEAKFTFLECDQLACLESIRSFPRERIAQLAGSADNVVFEHEIVGLDTFELCGYQSSLHRERKLEKTIQEQGICRAPTAMPDVLQRPELIFSFDWYVIAHGYEGVRPTPELDLQAQLLPGKALGANLLLQGSCFFGLLAVADAYGFKGPEEGRFWAMYYHILTPEEPFRWWNTTPVNVHTFCTSEVDQLRTSLESAIEDHLATVWKQVDSLPVSTVRRRLREAVAGVEIKQLSDFVEMIGESSTLSWKFYEGDLAAFYSGQ